MEGKLRLGVQRTKVTPVPDFLRNDGATNRLVLIGHEYESQTTLFTVGDVRYASLELQHVTNKRTVRQVDDLHTIDRRVVHQLELPVRAVIVGSKTRLSDAARYQIICRQPPGLDPAVVSQKSGLSSKRKLKYVFGARQNWQCRNENCHPSFLDRHISLLVVGLQSSGFSFVVRTIHAKEIEATGVFTLEKCRSEEEQVL